MKKYIYIVIALLLSLILISFLLSKLSYKVGGQRGYSKSLQESKERKVFVKQLNYEITPNNLKLNNLVFFIEKGFNYGNRSIFVTDSLIGNNQDYPYQLINGCMNYCKKFKSCDFDCDTKKYVSRDTVIRLESSSAFKLELANDFIRDTIIFDVIFYHKKGVSILKVDTVGKIKVWDGN